jgi:hypothetical protein
MRNADASQDWISRRTSPIACATALAAAFTLSVPQPAHADRVTPPSVPDVIQVPEGAEAFLVGHAVGTQDYVCLPTASSFAWTLITPEATLFGDNGKQIITHYFSPNPDPLDSNTNPRVVADGAIRATWQHSDTSTVWAFVEPGHSYNLPDFVEAGAVAWLRLTVVGIQGGPTGRNTLTKTTYIQRVNTSGGLAPSTGCSALADVGKQAFMPYTADYVFYEGPDDGAAGH